MRQCLTYGSVRGAARKGGPYRDRILRAQGGPECHPQNPNLPLRPSPPRQLPEDPLKQLRIENPRRLRKRPQRRPRTAQKRLHLLELAGPLDAPKARHDRIEEAQQDQ